jgi:hypothetical protein
MRLNPLEPRDTCFPDFSTTPNDSAKHWLRTMAFLPIFVFRALYFSEQFAMNRLQAAKRKYQQHLTPQSSFFHSNYKTQAGSAVDLLWTNKKPYFRDAPARFPNVEWSSSNTHGTDAYGILELYTRCPGSLYFELQRRMWQLRRMSPFLSSNLVFNVWNPQLVRPPKGCNSALSAYLAVALACGPQQSRKSSTQACGCILRRVFCVQRRLAVASQVQRHHITARTTLARGAFKQAVISDSKPQAPSVSFMFHPANSASYRCSSFSASWQSSAGPRRDHAAA